MEDARLVGWHGIGIGAIDVRVAHLSRHQLLVAGRRRQI
jgi:hypothetical protein